jgi:hypothetical protein
MLTQQQLRSVHQCQAVSGGGDDTTARNGLREQLVLSLPKAPTLLKLHIASFKLVEGFSSSHFSSFLFLAQIHKHPCIYIT